MAHSHRLPRGRIDDLFDQRQTHGFHDGIRHGYMQPGIEGLRGDVPHVRPPTLILRGNDDRTPAIELGQGIATRLPNGKIRVITDSGHSVQLDHADLVSASIEEAFQE